MSESPKNKDGDEHVTVGDVVCIGDADEHLDEVSCLVWFNGEDDDTTTVTITTPAGMFQLRDQVEIVFRLAKRKNVKDLKNRDNDMTEKHQLAIAVRRLIELGDAPGIFMTCESGGQANPCVRLGCRDLKHAQDVHGAIIDIVKAGRQLDDRQELSALEDSGWFDCVKAGRQLDDRQEQ